jgi:DsbC/DsbD-like thiol-disulfide interchange protein
MSARFATSSILALSLALCAGGTVPAVAMSVDEFVTISLIAGWRVKPDLHMAGIRIQMAPGWHTYWRQPGDAGIPPQLDWTGSVNFEGAEIVWPVPDRFDQNGLSTLGYSGEVILPLAVTPSGAGEIGLKGALFLGVCEDVCIPVEVSLAIALPDGGAAHAGIADSLARQPDEAGQKGRADATCSVTPIEDGLRVSIRLDLGGQGVPDQVVLESATANVWVSEPQLVMGADHVVATSDFVPPEAKPFVLERSKVVATLFQPGTVTAFSGCKVAP